MPVTSRSNRRCRFVLAALLVLGAAERQDFGRAQTPAAPTATGSTALRLHEGLLPVPGGRVWYRIAGTGAGTPILAIHGGPGGTSCRLRELARLGEDRPVIFYDQLDTGRSDRPANTLNWTLPYFVEEVQAIRDALALHEVVLFGHSWGGTVAAEYVLTHPGAGVRALILAGPLLSTSRWLSDADVLVSRLPARERQVIAAADKSERYDTPEFLAAVESFNARFNQRTPAVDYPECAGPGGVGNNAVYQHMWGPSEFRSTGTLRDYDRTTRLGELRLPVLLLGGEYDEARPETLRDFQRRISGSQLVVVPRAAHRILVDAPEQTVAAIRQFLARRGVP